VVNFSPRASAEDVEKTLDKMRSRSRKGPKAVERRPRRGDWEPAGSMKIIELSGDTEVAGRMPMGLAQLLRSRALFAEDVAARMGLALSDVRRLAAETYGWGADELSKGERVIIQSVWSGYSGWGTRERGGRGGQELVRLSLEGMKIVLWIESQPERPHARLVKVQQRAAADGRATGIPFVFYWDKVAGQWADGFEAHARLGLAVLNDAVEVVTDEEVGSCER
jgi:hypothetical protein